VRVHKRKLVRFLVGVCSASLLFSGCGDDSSESGSSASSETSAGPQPGQLAPQSPLVEQLATSLMRTATAQPARFNPPQYGNPTVTHLAPNVVSEAGPPRSTFLDFALRPAGTNATNVSVALYRFADGRVRVTRLDTEATVQARQDGFQRGQPFVPPTALADVVSAVRALVLAEGCPLPVPSSAELDEMAANPLRRAAVAAIIPSCPAAAAALRGTPALELDRASVGAYWPIQPGHIFRLTADIVTSTAGVVALQAPRDSTLRFARQEFSYAQEQPN